MNREEPDRLVQLAMLVILFRGIAEISVHLPLQNREWHRARVQDSVMKLVQGKPAAEGFFRLLAQFDDFELTDHIGARLARVHDISFDFAGLDAVVDCLLASPAFGMNAGIDHEPPRPE